MCKSICGADCVNCEFGRDNNCKGCIASEGCPLGKECFIYKYIKTGGKENYELFKKQLLDEINALNIPGMPAINELYAINGSYVNTAYPMPSGYEVKLLDDKEIYLCNQLECEFGGNRCFGIAANMDFILICTYEENGENPELVIYKKR